MRLTRIAFAVSAFAVGHVFAMDHDMSMHDGNGADMSTMIMHSPLGPEPMSRDASGTSWQPDAAPMLGIHGTQGDWHSMLHGFADVVYDDQSGPRGATKTFTEGMLMGMAWRPLGSGTLGLHAMVSVDPTIGTSGYPLLFQTGETADGKTPLTDRQHPHDLFMELSASYSQTLSHDSAVYGYVGLPGEPALGPPAFMHRFSGMDNPEAPLTHHWLDSTHITFGVGTLGYSWRVFKIEVSGFNGREPDENRYNIETRRFDSASARLSWNPSPEWALQISRGYLASPEMLEPEVSVRRTTASAMYQHNFDRSQWQTTLAWGRNEKDPGDAHDGYLLESAIRFSDRYTLFGRAERVQNDELFIEGEPLHGETFAIKKITLGGIYDFFNEHHVRLGVGALASRYDAPSALDSVYGSRPHSSMVFLRARLE